MSSTVIMGIQIGDRQEAVPNVQDLLTEFGCIIKTRLGLHQNLNTCSSRGLIIVEFYKEEEKINELKKRLEDIENVVVKTMEF